MLVNRIAVCVGLLAIALCACPAIAQDGACADGCCADPGCCDPGCADACGGGCCNCSGIVAGAEILFLDVFAKQGAGGQFGNAMADFDYEACFRFWAGYEFESGLEIRFRYFTYDEDGEWSDPFGAVIAEENLQIDMYDVELADDLCIGCWTLSPSIGVRWGDVELSAPFGGVEVSGVGAVVGLDARRSIGGCWSVYANGRYGVLYGDTDMDLRGGELLIAMGTDDTFFETIEMQVGLQWSRCTAGGANLFARAGWEQQVYLVDDMIFGGRAEPGDISLAGPAFAIGLDR